MVWRVKSLEEMSMTERELPEIIIEPGLLVAGGLFCIAGMPGEGKSFMAQQIAYELATGRLILGLFKAKRCRVAYFELEKQNAIAVDRFMNPNWQKEYNGAYPSWLGYFGDTPQNINIDSKDDYNRLFEAIKESKAKVVIIDSFSVTTSADENAIKPQKLAISRYRDIAKQLNIGMVLVTHINKPKRDKEGKAIAINLSDIRGSSILSYTIDTAIGVCKKEKQKKLQIDAEGMPVKVDSMREVAFLKHSFSRVDLQGKPNLDFVYDADTPQPYKFVDKMCGEIMKILNASEYGIMPYSDLEHILGCSHNTLRGKCGWLQEYGFVDIITTEALTNTFVKQRSHTLGEEIDLSSDVPLYK